jgi:hypothetical protein
MRNMSVSCDCEGTAAAPVVTPNVGILSSTDILAIDQACVDIIYAMTAEEHHDMLERIESRHGYRQLSYMKELGMGHDRYVLIDLDNGGKKITAAEAAKDFIDSYGSQYPLMDNYTDAIIKNAHTEKNTEVIFYRSDVSQGWNSYGYYNDVPVGEGGNGGLCPSQNLVDMYDMANGAAPFEAYDNTGAPVYTSSTACPAVKAGSYYDDSRPTAGRDPRLAATILSHGVAWNGRTLNIVRGGDDNPIGNANATPTGYYTRKYMPEAILVNHHAGNSYRNWIYIRYAEILLNYAEALNEFNFAANKGTICNVLDQIRHRGGITGNVASRTDLNSQEAMRKFIRKERTVELAFEEHRWWDVRRWNVANEALSRDIIGVEVAKNGKYSRKVAQQRIFEDRMYLYPIPETEYWKTGFQNPNW